ncbi:MAG: flagellar basal body P-ring formation protein FlgA [Gammaproteobacteria bacterium]|nr:flagellar basal body P-ring formation protein FlgA [Gammaproteobacteria bacterium]
MFLAASFSLQAEEQSHDSIYRAAEAHIQQRLGDLPAPAEIKVSELDRRLSLNSCELPLETFDPPSFRRLGRTSVGVRCTGAKPWSLFVSASVRAELPVVVASRALARGSLVQHSDVQLQSISSDELLADYLTQLDEASGKRLRRNVSSGEVLNSGMLLIPKAVKYGNQVTLITRVAGLEVRMKGKSLGQGSIGERVAVENLSSQRRVEGIIRSTDLIEVQ